MIDKYTLAATSLVGSSCDVLGALYLAYDLLGGEHGPLRTVTRAVTYGALVGVSCGVTVAPLFGLAAGTTHGLTLGWEFSRASKGKSRSSPSFESAMSAIRGVGYAVGSGILFGPVFGLTFGVLSTAGQSVAYRLGIRPSMDYAPGTRPRITRKQLLAALNRTVGYALTGFISAYVAHQRSRAWSVGLHLGVVVGAVTAVLTACTPFVEWMADHMPARRMGVVGIALILLGFALQSVQYWVALLDLEVR